MRGRATLTAAHLHRVMTYVQSNDAIDLLREARGAIQYRDGHHVLIGIANDGLLARVDEVLAAHDKKAHEAELALERR